MPGPFVHQIDPVIGEFGGFYLWWYGLSYTLGFLGVYLWFRRSRHRLGMTLSEVYSISLHLAVGVLLGGRFVEVVFYEWNYYSHHLLHIPAYWLGGMATHGLILGGILGVLIFCLRRKKSFIAIADELAIPGLWVMGVGRLGNFIDGQIAGTITNAWWAVQFPDLEGFRHPIVLYDGMKNLLLIPFLLWIRKNRPSQGVVFAHSVFWYAFLRIFVDMFREYRVESFGLGMGQIINLAMSLLGLILLIRFYRKSHSATQLPLAVTYQANSKVCVTLWAQRVLFMLVLLFCLIMPSDWTQDIPQRYGKRHPGLKYSFLYPRIEERSITGETKAKENGIMPNQGIQPSP
jgi:phosphatidylglycerol:prolipoprotein diacylglycerol transferase